MAGFISKFDVPLEDEEPETLTKCPSCNGAGLRRCWICKGSGKHSWESIGPSLTRVVFCKACAGEGSRQCPICKGCGLVRAAVASRYRRWVLGY